MKKILIFIMLLTFNAGTYAQDAKPNNKPIETGFVFIDGKYIEPPYTIIKKGLAIYINGIQATKAFVFPEVNKYYFDHDPGIPPCIDSITKIKDMGKCKVPGTSLSYNKAMEYYLYTHFEFGEALKKHVEYYKKLPNIKDVILTKDLGYVVIPKNDESFPYAFGMNMKMKHVPDKWGPKGTGSTSKEDFETIINEQIRHIYIDLKNYVLFFETSHRYYDIKSFYDIKKIYKIIADSTLTDSILINKIKKDSTLYIKNHKEFLKCIQNIQFKKLFLKSEKIEINKHQVLNKYLTQVKEDTNKMMKNIMKSINSNNTTYSPSKKIINAWCGTPYEIDFIDIDAEINNVKDRILNQGYSTFNVFKAVNPYINDIGNCSYSNLVNMKYSGLLYLSGHGYSSVLATDDVPGTENTILLLLANSNSFLDGWCSSNIHIKRIEINHEDEDSPTGQLWGAYATPDWAINNWKQELITSKAISVISACYSQINGWTQACLGGVSFGYSGIAYENFVKLNNQNLFDYMNGTSGSGKYRIAKTAYVKMIKFNGFSISESSNNITLCPGIVTFSPGDGAPVSNTGHGFIQPDTKCAPFVGTSAGTAVTGSVIIGQATLSSFTWEIGANGIPRIGFDWYNNSGLPFKIKISIDGSQIKSDDGTVTNIGVHSLDANNKAPNGDNFTYYFEQEATSTIDFHENNGGQKSIGLNASFTGTSNITGITSWNWDFGDGYIYNSTTQSIVNGVAQTDISYTYSYPDVYEVSLTANGTVTRTRTKFIIVIDPSSYTPLVLSCAVSPSSPQLGTTVDFIGEIVTDYDPLTNYTYVFQLLNSANQVVAEETRYSNASIEYFTQILNDPTEHSYLISVVDNNNSYNMGVCNSTVYPSSPLTDCLTAYFDGPQQVRPYDDINLSAFVNSIYPHPPYSFIWEFGYDIETGTYQPSLYGAGIQNTLGSNPPTFHYYNVGTYPIWLTVYDAMGCSFQYHSLVSVTIPDPTNCFDLKLLSAYDYPGPYNYDYALVRNDHNCTFNIEFYSIPTNDPSCDYYSPDANQWGYEHSRWYYDGYIRAIYPNIDCSYMIWDCHRRFSHSDLTQHVAQVRAEVYNGTYPDPGPPYYYPDNYGKGEISVGVINCAGSATSTTIGFTNGALSYHNTGPYYFASGNISAQGNYISANNDINSYINSHKVILEACNSIVLENNFTTGNSNFIAGSRRLSMANCHPNNTLAKIINNTNTDVINTTDRENLNSKNLNKASTGIEFLVYPNPAKDNTTIRFNLPDDGYLEISLIDLLGRRINTIVNNFTNAGEYELLLNTVKLAEGIYTIVFKFGNQNKYIKLNKSKNL